MQLIFDLKDLSWRERLQLSGILCFLITLPFERELNQICMGALLATSIPSISLENFRKYKNTILILILPYLVAVFSSFYSSDFILSLKVLEIQLTLFLLPVILCCSYIPGKKKEDIIFTSFIVSVTSALIILLVSFIIKMHKLQLPVSDWFQEQFLNHNYSQPIKIHASFFSAYVTLSLFLIINYLSKTKLLWLKIVLPILILLHLISLFMLASRLVLFISIASLLIMVPYLFAAHGRWKNLLILGSTILVLLVYFFSKSNYLENRFTNNLDKDIKISTLFRIVQEPDSASKKVFLQNDGSRIERWIAGVELFKKRPFLGFGTGDEKKMLFSQYEKMGLTVTLQQRYDSHNQFLAYAIKSGVLGLVAFLITLGYSIYSAFKSKNVAYIVFLMTVTGICFIDNFLEVNKGIFFFAFFNTLFLIITTFPNNLPQLKKVNQ